MIAVTVSENAQADIATYAVEHSLQTALFGKLDDDKQLRTCQATHHQFVQE